MIVYLNGDFLDQSRAYVSVDDRGFLFADGVYEVARVYQGRIFQLEPHLLRMRQGLSALRIRDDMVAQLPAIAERLIDTNELRGDATVYFQITRGAAPRTHAFPQPEVAPTVYVIARSFQRHPDHYFADGVAAITVPDTRWSRCDIKSIALLPNVLANQLAKDKGAFETLFVRDGRLMEGSHTNVFGVIDGEAITSGVCGHVLSGITRNLILARAHEAGVVAREAPVLVEPLDRIEELFLTGTTTDIMPVAKIDDRTVGTGKPGPVTRQLQRAFEQWTSFGNVRA
jgi:D-alanine transaminase